MTFGPLVRRGLGVFACLLGGGGCGEDTRSLDIALSVASSDVLDPFAPTVGLRSVRVFVTGNELYDEVVLDLDGSGTVRAATVDGLSSPEVDVRVEGYDAGGSVVAFARSARLDLDSTSFVEVLFRRNLAYVTHRPNSEQAQPARSLYAIDLARRGLVDRIQLPGTDPVARSVTARGGGEIIVTWQDEGRGFAGLINLDDHSLTRTIELPGVQTLTLGVEREPWGVALGGGRVTFLNFDDGSTEDLGRLVGGRVLDAAMAADGRRVLVAIDVSPGLLLIDVENRRLEGHAVVPDPSGVAMDAAGQVAFVTSRSNSQVAAFDLDNRRARTLGAAGFPVPVDLAVYSDALRSVLGVDRSGRVGRILSFHVPSERASPLNESVETLENPAGVATDGTGRTLVVVASGTSTQSAGLTLVDTFVNRLEGSAQLYPSDPDDTYVITPASPDRAEVRGRHRYQPTSVAVVYGR